jgi:hypothetical protein
MKIMITGTKGLALALSKVYADHNVTLVSRSTGHDILKVDTWGQEFLDHDMVFNCAYQGQGQQLVLEYFYDHWKDRADKSIICIGSKIITQPRIEQEKNSEFWPYRLHKQSLQLTCDAMWSQSVCDLKIINPGAFDSDMIKHLAVPKISLEDLAIEIRSVVQNPLMKRVDLWL